VTSAPTVPSGVGTVDPTSNVRELVAAETKRQDDLRVASERRQDELRQASELRLDEVAEIRAIHARELNEAETKRIDAIRAVDVAAVSIAAERTSASATVLANQVAQSAETLRALVATTAAASASATAASFGQLSDRITLLERTSYEGSGKSAVTDPAMAKMLVALEQIQLNIAKGQGREGMSTPLLMTIAAAVAGFVGFFIQAMLKVG